MGRSRSTGQTTRRSIGTSAPSRPYSSAAAPAPSVATAPRPAVAHPPAVSHSTPAPAPHAPAAAAPPAPFAAPAQSGGGLLSGLAGTVMSGMAFGTGSAVAHRAVDSIMGPRQVEHVHKDEAGTTSGTMQAIDSTSSNSSRTFTCQDETQQFQSCLSQNNGNLSSCQFFFDVLTQCKQGMKQ